jgi:hypothetical protein
VVPSPPVLDDDATLSIRRGTTSAPPRVSRI